MQCKRPTKSLIPVTSREMFINFTCIAATPAWSPLSLNMWWKESQSRFPVDIGAVVLIVPGNTPFLEERENENWESSLANFTKREKIKNKILNLVNYDGRFIPNLADLLNHWTKNYRNMQRGNISHEKTSKTLSQHQQH